MDDSHRFGLLEGVLWWDHLEGVPWRWSARGGHLERVHQRGSLKRRLIEVGPLKSGSLKWVPGGGQLLGVAGGVP
jgi:hypothetical protein